MKITSDIKERKYRHEYKFLVNAKQRAMLYSRLKNLIPEDSHVGDSGSYWIRSCYFDDLNNSAYRQNEAGVNERTKYRIRIYNASDSAIFLECKSKKNSMTNKESVSLTREQVDALILGQAPPLSAMENDAELLKRFKVLMHTKILRPKVIIEYERFPFVFKQGNVRITFDENISSSLDTGRFFDKDNTRYPVLPKGQSLMEVKYDEYLPSFIRDNLELGRLSQTSFSKYYLGRKYTLPGNGGRLK